jgi:hypothetical protein
MVATDVLLRFLREAVESAKARRYITLVSMKKGQEKFLSSLHHEFEQAVRPNRAVRDRSHNDISARPCYVFSPPKDFGIPFATVREAYESLATTDSWLIVTSDGTSGIYRPEDRWDDEVLITVPKQDEERNLPIVGPTP